MYLNQNTIPTLNGLKITQLSALNVRKTKNSLIIRSGGNFTESI